LRRSAWRRDPDTGLPQERFARLDESYLTATDPPRLRRELWPAGTCFNANSLASEVTGERRPDRIVAAARNDPAYPWWFLYEDAATQTGILGWATHPSSFAAWVSSYQAATARVQQANLRRGRCPVGSGSVVA
jgi:hypothetical protein